MNVTLLVAELTRREGFVLDRTFLRRFCGIIAACAVMGAVVFALVGVLSSGFAPQSGVIVQGASLLTLVGGGLLAYLGAAHLFGAAQFRDLIKDADR